MVKMLDLSPYRNALFNQSLLRRVGRVERVTGLIIESNGPTVGLGDLCRLHISNSVPPAMAEVVGFRQGRVQLMALTAVEGIRSGTDVVATRRPFRVPVGDVLLGRTVDAWGHAIDGGDPISFRETRPVVAAPPAAMSRRRIDSGQVDPPRHAVA
jgi:flagellum-specific ATP synthase